MTITADQSTPLTPTIDQPCPDWCRAPKGHGWESEYTTGRVVRYHTHQIESEPWGTVAISAEETAPCIPCSCGRGADCTEPYETSGPSVTSQPVVTAYDVPDELEPDQATELAMTMRRAAVLAKRWAEQASVCPDWCTSHDPSDPLDPDSVIHRGVVQVRTAGVEIVRVTGPGATEQAVPGTHVLSEIEEINGAELRDWIDALTQAAELCEADNGW